MKVPGVSVKRTIRRAVVPGGGPGRPPPRGRRDTYAPKRNGCILSMVAIAALLLGAILTTCQGLPDDFSKLRSGASTHTNPEGHEQMRTIELTMRVQVPDTISDGQLTELNELAHDAVGAMLPDNGYSDCTLITEPMQDVILYVDGGR